jgi:uncharacterized protein YneF (UPF0154 family)
MMEYIISIVISIIIGLIIGTLYIYWDEKQRVGR